MTALLHYLGENSLEDLRKNVSVNLARYESPVPWLPEYFEEAEWSFPSLISFERANLIEDKDPRNDAENAKRLFLTLQGLSLSQANDERLWVYLSHTEYWSYMRARWAVETTQFSPASFIENRYFFGKKRGVLYNGISRLWLIAHATYDETRKDPFELTHFFLQSQEFAHQLLDRNYTRNRTFLRHFLSVLLSENWVPKHKKPMVDLIKFIQRQSGVTVLDALNEDDIRRILVPYLQKNTATGQLV